MKQIKSSVTKINQPRKKKLTINYYNFNKISKHKNIKEAEFLSRTNNLTYD